MSSGLRYEENQPITIDNEPFIDSAGLKITTAVGVITIRRLSDFGYFNGTTFVATPTQLAMTKIGDVNSPGAWNFSLPTGLAEDEYIVEITDTSGNAANSIQIGKLIVDDKLVKLARVAASGAAGRSVYDPVTSLMTLFKFGDNSTVIAVFLMLDENGNPAGSSPFFEKLPQ